MLVDKLRSDNKELIHEYRHMPTEHNLIELHGHDGVGGQGKRIT